MLPIVFTTPRSGSSLVSQIISNYFVQHFDHGPYLDEFFTINKLWKVNYITDNWIYCKNFSRNKVENNLKYDRNYIQLEIKKRINLLEENDIRFKQLIKLFPFNLDNNLFDFVSNKYNFFILLERKNKVNQFLSFTKFLSNNIALYCSDTNITVDYIYYNKEHLTKFLNIIENYEYYKNKFIKEKKYKIIYYEDLFNNKNIEATILEQLELKITKHFKSLNYQTIPTPYSKNIEELIVNKNEWYKDRDKLIMI